MKLSVGFSPCPNDTFIFDAMLHGRVDTEGLEFVPLIEDVETLNNLAFESGPPVTKLSYHAFAHLTDKYSLLDAGSALGTNCGPLLIAKRPLTRKEIIEGKIAIPGKLTTANFLFSLAYSEAKNKVEMLFSEIEKAVLEGKVLAGVIIHENRFTYQDKGLVKIIDCGEYWEEKTGLPIPLGGIAVRKDVPEEIQLAVNRILRRSVEYAFEHPNASKDFVKKHAWEMDEEVIRQHIELYVNTYSIDLGPVGRKAVQTLFEEAVAHRIIEKYNREFFLNYEKI